ncbi:MAG TPA: hypothetical protein VMS17_01220 [Gemmataceae bacterium]|nr:hypothetical protein [Gemmataceae bacterium]
MSAQNDTKNAVAAPDLNAAPARKWKKPPVWFPMLFGLFGLFPLLTLGILERYNLGFHAVARLIVSAVGLVVFGVGLGLTLGRLLFRGE